MSRGKEILQKYYNSFTSQDYANGRLVLLENLLKRLQPILHLII